LPVAAIPLVVLVVVKGIWWRRRGTAWRERVPQRYAKV
jgi:hypothetical protein